MNRILGEESFLNSKIFHKFQTYSLLQMEPALINHKITKIVQVRKKAKFWSNKWLHWLPLLKKWMKIKILSSSKLNLPSRTCNQVFKKSSREWGQRVYLRPTQRTVLWQRSLVSSAQTKMEEVRLSWHHTITIPTNQILLQILRVKKAPQTSIQTLTQKINRWAIGHQIKVNSYLIWAFHRTLGLQSPIIIQILFKDMKNNRRSKNSELIFKGINLSATQQTKRISIQTFL